ncbi:hypothetical protein [Fulvivirga sediminis]|uniref:Secreted protein n=1 Tax=Fulvivirga sediminis TaxID=2803949 RepID=A0A937F966_9BACT|nr:hypothetical protein [Fulvivirga sediminis]MBL3657526.1 hypothetical protein [Fulvivirga sediminis]
MKIVRLLLIIMAFSSFPSLISCDDPYEEVANNQEDVLTDPPGGEGESTRGD